MDAASQNKTERINLRVKSSAKDIITPAAGFEGKTVSHFTLTSALKCAEKKVQEHQMMIIRGQASPDSLAQAFVIGEAFIGSDPVTLIPGDNIFYGEGLSDRLQAIAGNDKGATVFGSGRWLRN